MTHKKKYLSVHKENLKKGIIKKIRRPKPLTARHRKALKDMFKRIREVCFISLPEK